MELHDVWPVGPSVQARQANAHCIDSPFDALAPSVSTSSSFLGLDDLFQRIHLRSWEIAKETEAHSGGLSNAARIALRSVRPPGWYCNMALQMIPKALADTPHGAALAKMPSRAMLPCVQDGPISSASKAPT